MCFEGVLRVFQGSFKKTFKVFQKMFYVSWHSSQLHEQKEGLFFDKLAFNYNVSIFRRWSI